MKTILIILLVLLGKNTFGQKSEQDILSAKVAKILSVDVSQIKDSTAVYCFALKLMIKEVQGKNVVKDISFSDSISSTFLRGCDKLKTLDFSPLLEGNKNASVLIPVSIIVVKYLDGKIEEPVMPIRNFSEKIQKLFFRNAKNSAVNSIYTEPIFIYIDKTVYN